MWCCCCCTLTPPPEEEAEDEEDKAEEDMEDRICLRTGLLGSSQRITSMGEIGVGDAHKLAGLDRVSDLVRVRWAACHRRR